MRKNILIVLLVGISLVFFSCIKQERAYAPPVFPKTEKIQSTCLSEGLIINYPFDMFVSDRYIFVLALANDTWLQVYDKNTGEYVDGFITKGQGPGEIVTGLKLFFDAKTRTISIFDQSAMKLLFYHLNDDVLNLITFKGERALHNLNGVVRCAWLIQDSLLLIDGQIGKAVEGQKRFQLLADNRVIDEYNDFPVENVEEQLIFMSPLITLSPDKTKMAVGTLYGGLLESFNLTDKIENVNVRRFYKPILQFQSGVIRNTEETVFGFSALCATNDKIYSVLIGNKDPNVFNNISIFDWNGREEKKYITDCNVLKLATCSEEPHKIYGIAFSDSREFYLVSFTL